MPGPIIKIAKGPSPTHTGALNAAAYGLASLFSAASKAADIYPQSDDGLLTVLHHRIQIAKHARHRSRWIGGRLFNRLSGEDPDYIPVSGTHLRQTLAIAGVEPPDFVTATGQYLLRLDVSEKARTQLIERHNRSKQTD